MTESTQNTNVAEETKTMEQLVQEAVAQAMGYRQVKDDEPSGTISDASQKQEQASTQTGQHETVDNPPMSDLTLVEDSVVFLNRYINKKSFILEDIARAQVTLEQRDGFEPRVKTVLVFNSGVVATVYEKHAILFHDNWKNVLRITFSKSGHPLMFTEPRRQRTTNAGSIE